MTMYNCAAGSKCTQGGRVDDNHSVVLHENSCERMSKDRKCTCNPKHFHKECWQHR